MNIEQLEAFIWTVRLGSFGVAAERLYTSQSTVTFRIQQLEERMGVNLFDRSHHKPKLTSKGRQLIPYVERLMAITSDIEHQIAGPTTLGGIVKMGVADLIAVTWLPELAIAVRQEYSRVNLEITMDLPRTLITRLCNSDLDIALIPGPVVNRDLESRSLGHVEFGWMASPHLDIPARNLSPRDLAKLPIIGVSQESHHYRNIKQWFKGAGATYSFVTGCNNMSAVIALTVAGQGVSYLAPIACKQEIDGGSLRILNARPKMPKVEFFVVSLKGRSQPLIRAITSLASEVSAFIVH